MMTADSEKAQIIASLKSEMCLSTATTEAYFSKLATKPTPRDSEEAKAQACAIVEADPDLFACQGQVVPTELHPELIRLEHLSALPRRIPDFVDLSGMSESKILMASDEELEPFTQAYTGPVLLGHPRAIVWTSCAAACADLIASIPDLCDRLGLNEGQDRVILCIYASSEIGCTLHVPRALDGLPHSRFLLNQDCDATAGRTRPLRQPIESGLPEFVHRACSIAPRKWELRHIVE